jgi:hypothetical protein
MRNPGCFAEEPDTWITYLLRMFLLDRFVDASGNAFWDVDLELTGQVEDGPPQSIVKWNKTVPGYFRIGAGPATRNYGWGFANFFPYFTNKDPKQSHGLMQRWYADIICSRQRIPHFGESATVISVPPTQGSTVTDFTAALQKCKDAYDGVAAVAVETGFPAKTIDQQIADATAAGATQGAAQQLATDQQAIADANAAKATADNALAAYRTAVAAKVALLKSDDAAQDQHIADLEAL